MKLFLIEANLPRRVPTWQNEAFQFVVDLNDEWSDSEIWNYAKLNDFTIVTKDADFSNRIIMSAPPPKIIHLRLGNMRLRNLMQFINLHWHLIATASKNHKLVNVFVDRIETIE